MNGTDKRKPESEALNSLLANAISEFRALPRLLNEFQMIRFLPRGVLRKKTQTKKEPIL